MIKLTLPSFRLLNSGETLEALDRALSKINNINQRPQEKNWSDNWAEFLPKLETKQRICAADLSPNYFNNGINIFRHEKKFITCDTNIEYQVLSQIKDYLFDKYISKCDNLCEFGAGTNHNLLYFSAKKDSLGLHSYDWARSSQQIVEVVNRKNRTNIYAEKFDMRIPHKVKVPKNAALFTSGSLEQLGDDFPKFTEFAKQYAVRIHIEPIIEFYDTNCIMDDTAIRYHKARKYLGNFRSSLKGVIEENRLYFGNLYNEGYSIIVW